MVLTILKVFGSIYNNSDSNNAIHTQNVSQRNKGEKNG